MEGVHINSRWLGRRGEEEAEKGEDMEEKRKGE